MNLGNHKQKICYIWQNISKKANSDKKYISLAKFSRQDFQNLAIKFYTVHSEIEEELFDTVSIKRVEIFYCEKL